MSPTVSVVIVNYNRAELLRAAVVSILAQTRAPDEVIVVDNGSSDASVAMVEREFGPAVRLVRLERNLGFAGGNNAGIRASAGEWVALINNDAEADPRWLEEMMAAASSHPANGMTAGRTILMGRRDLLDNRGVGLYDDGMSRGAGHFRRSAAVARSEIFIPSGCAMLLSRRAFDEAGGFDPEFFCYSEDTDLFVRVRLLGYRCAVADRAVVYHYGSGTLGAISPAKIYWVERNRVSVLLRYYPVWKVPLSLVPTALRYAGLAWALRQRRAAGPRERSVSIGPAGLAALFRAYRDAVRRAPEDWRRRREWQDRTRLPPGMMAHWLRRHRLDRRSLHDLEPA